MTDPALPRLRTRLALLHTGLAFACGVGLLAVVAIGLFNGNHTADPGAAAGGQRSTNFAEVLRYSALALVVLAVASIALGWLIAGRGLRPLHEITRSARDLSANNLDSRLRVPAAYQEFTELADTLDGLLQRLHESFTAQRQFVANASHELRTPLTVQRTLLQLTLADPDATAETLRSACRELLDLGRQQEDLITALLTLANGYQEIDHWEEFDLADLTEAVVLNHRAEAEQRGISVHTTLVPTTVTGDPPLAASLVTNLIGNAVRHNLPGGTIEIGTSDSGRLTVSNTGPVIPPAELDRLLQPFERLAPDRTDQSSGHGLGLPIISAIAKAHHARLDLDPHPTGGLHITVAFPT
jgi:signal transduction histidine kinase